MYVGRARSIQTGSVSLAFCKIGAAEEIRTRNNKGWVPMMLAYYEGHLDVCERAVDFHVIKGTFKDTLLLTFDVVSVFWTR